MFRNVRHFERCLKYKFTKATKKFEGILNKKFNVIRLQIIVRSLLRMRKKFFPVYYQRIHYPMSFKKQIDVPNTLTTLCNGWGETLCTQYYASGKCRARLKLVLFLNHLRWKWRSIQYHWLLKKHGQHI